MANIADNQTALVIKKGTTYQRVKIVLDDFLEKLSEYAEGIESDDFILDNLNPNEALESNYMQLFFYESKWAEPKEMLQEFVTNNPEVVTIMGVCTEWGMQYTSAYEFEQTKTT